MSSESFDATLVSPKDELPRGLKFITVAVAATRPASVVVHVVANA
jgi:hypothetical protein